MNLFHEISLTILTVIFITGLNGATICPIQVCPPEMTCSNGFAKDISGCQTCTCNPSPCYTKYCPIGTVCKEVCTSDGENTTNFTDLTIPCAHNITAECISTNCLNISCSRITCLSIQLAENSRCRTCECTDPCEGVICPINEKCIKTNDTSKYRCINSIPLNIAEDCECPPPSTLFQNPSQCLDTCPTTCYSGSCGPCVGPRRSKCCPNLFGCTSCEVCNKH